MVRKFISNIKKGQYMSRRHTLNTNFAATPSPVAPAPPVKLNGKQRLYGPDRNNPNRIKYFNIGDEVRGDNRWPGVVEEIDLEHSRLRVRFAAYTNSTALMSQKPLPSALAWVSAYAVDLALPSIPNVRM